MKYESCIPHGSQVMAKVIVFVDRRKQGGEGWKSFPDIHHSKLKISVSYTWPCPPLEHLSLSFGNASYNNSMLVARGTEMHISLEL